MKLAHKPKRLSRAVASQFLSGLAGLALITFVCFHIGFGIERTGLAYLTLIALISLLGSFGTSVVLSIVAMGCLNYFFVSPLFDFRVDDPNDIVRLAAFLTTSLVVTALTAKLKRTQVSLAESNAKLEEAQRIASVGWWEREFTTGHVALSEEVCRIFGLQPVDLPEWHGRWLTLIHPEDRPRAEEAAAAALLPGGPRYDVEYRVVRRDRTERVVHSQGDVTWDETGRPLRQFGVLQDITELRQAEQKLRTNEAKLERAQAIAHVGWWERDFNSDRVTVSDEVCRILGERPTGRWLHLIPPEDRPRVVEAAEAALGGGSPVYDTEYRVARPDGSMRLVRHQGEVTRDTAGRPLREFGVLQDITELREAEQKLRTSEARFRTIVDYASDAFLVFDDNSTVLDVNREACRSLGFSREELIGKHRADFDTALNEEMIEGLKQRLISGETITFETRHRRKDGTTFPVEVRVGDFKQGGERRFLCLVRDITERKRAEDELRESEERFRTLVQFSFDAYWESDAQHRFIHQEFANPADAVRNSAIGKTRWEAPNLEFDAEASREHREILDSHLPFRDFEVARPAPEGGKRYFAVSGLPKFDNEGRFIGYRGVGRDITERKQAEERLRRNETYLAAAESLSKMGSWAWRPAANEITHWSQGRYRLFGFDPADGVPSLEAVLERIHPDDRALWLESRSRVARGEESDLDFRIVLPDGVTKHVHAVGRPILSQSGEVVEVMGAAADISERKRAENELRESEARFRSFVDHASDGFFLFDESQALIDVNRQAWESLGYTRDEMVGMHPGEFDAGLDPGAIARIGERVKAGETVTFESLHRRKDGTSFPVEVRARQFQLGAHQFRLSLARDISERTRAEEALRRSEAYLAESQRLSHTGTTVFDKTGPVFWSEESYRIWGFDPLRGIPSLPTILQRVHPDDRDRLVEEFGEALRQRRHYALEFRILLPDGTLKHIESVGHPLSSDRAKPVEILGTHADVTERKRAQEQHERLRQLEADLAHVNRLSMMGELTASLAHEILHPIATARNNARAAIRFLDKSPPNMIEVRGALESIVRDADRGKDIVDRIRDHVKKAPPRNDRFDLNGAIGEVIEMVRAAIDKNHVSVRARLAPDSASISGDRVQLQQVVMNLVLNAVEAMGSVEEGARSLSVTTDQNGDGGILVAIRDSGPGIDQEHLQKIFERFYTTKDSGVGMGLAICRSIIEAHGGRLWAEPNQPRGAVFQFTLPAAKADS